MHARKSLLLKKQFFSSWLEIFLVGPQRSILGPLLFNILLNDLLWFNEKTDICNFADNNTLLCTIYQRSNRESSL